jgi:hypothetical protein
MNINRNNYENFFLLYVDGELAPQEMLEVDAFCGKHPDLAEELQLLMETKLDTDADFTFPEKAELLKMEPWDAENLTPLQSAMLSMLDGEAVSDELKTQLAHNTEWNKEWTLLHGTQLPAESVSLTHKHTLIKAQPWDADNLTTQQLQLLEALENGSEIPAGVVGDPELQKDWMLLQQSLLQPALVTMPGKQKLYRKEQDEKAPVVRMGWMRIAAAAAVMVGIGWVVFNSMSNTTDPKPTSGQEGIAQQPVKQPVVNTPVVNGKDTALITTPLPAVKEQPEVLYAVENKRNNPVKIDQAVASNTQVSNELTQEENAHNERARLIAANRLSPEEAASLNLKNTNGLPEPQTAVAPRKLQNNLASTVGNDADNNATVQYALMQETDEEEYISIGGAKVNKQKLRNVFRTVTRKVTRSLDKSTVAPAVEMR